VEHQQHNHSRQYTPLRSEPRVCPKTGRIINPEPLSKVDQTKPLWLQGWKKWLFPITGLIALIWFLVRVIPKPSRAAYPCQRAAAPLAVSFLMWLTGLFGGAVLLRKLARAPWANKKWRPLAMALGLIVLAASVIWSLQFLPGKAVALTQLAPSKVAVVQSSQANCKDIQYAEIKTMVENAINLAGGFSGVIRNGDTVVLKPNLVANVDYTSSRRPLTPEVNGVTTDYRVTRAVAELVRAVNPNGKIYVMEGCADGSTQTYMNALNYTASYIPNVDGFFAIETDSGGWQETTSPNLVKVSLPDGLLHTEYYYNRRYYEANVIISLPTMKTHWSACVTGANKNIGIGATPGNIYGTSATNPNRNPMVIHDNTAGDLHKWIRDYVKAKPINFVIMDGLQGIQYGPIPGYKDSISDIAQDQMNMRLILAGKDAVAVDTVESLIIGWDPQSVKHLTYLNNDSMGNLDTACIDVLGKKVDEVRKDFAGPIPVAGGSKITDKTAPTLTLNSVTVSGSTLNISLAAASETVKVEVYIDGELRDPVIRSNPGSISVNISGLASGNHTLSVNAYDRFLNRAEQTRNFNTSGTVTTPTPTSGTASDNYTAPRANQLPTIDGVGTDSCWSQAAWADIKYLWLGTQPGPSDFTGRFKMVWGPDRLYYLIEITDNVLSAPYTGLNNYYNNDCVELFIDENHSGGDHTNNYNAWAYHMELNGDIIDNNTRGQQQFYNDHANYTYAKDGNTYRWEIALKVFADTYNENITTNQPVTLTAGKVMGFGVSYNDNDGGTARESFMGSMDIPGTDKNVAYKNASVFAALTLSGGMTTATPTSGYNPTPTPTLRVTPSPTARPTPTPGSGSISIAAGRSSALGSFQADRYYSGGSTYSNSNTVDVSQITSNPPPAALFNNERYGAMSYTIPGFMAGSLYTVTLYFAETYLMASGSRRFNVSINGATVLSNFDIYASAGGQNKAIARSFTATANSNGQIVIQFTAVTQNPKINGISIK